MQALEDKARAGDVAAQFDWALSLDREGRRAEATAWLETAARGGHAEALTLLAVADLQGLDRPRDPLRARERLSRAVLLGGNSARRLLAVLTATGEFAPPDWRGAVTLLIEAAKAGDWQALRELGLLVEMASPRDALAEDLLLRAGLAGDGLAGFAILRRQALHGRTLASARVFEQWRAGVQRIGHPLAAQVATVVAEPGTTPQRPGPTVAWERIASLLESPPGTRRPASASLSERPQIHRYDELFSAEECEYLIGLASQLLVPAGVADKATGQGKHSTVRRCSAAVFWPFNQDLVIHALNLRLSAAAGLPVENGEMLNVLMYKPGDEYLAHFDFFPTELATADPNGQRIRTLLVYLNLDYDGGETHFITAGMKLRGKQGEGVLFHNCDPDGAPDRTTLHAGLPVGRGQKWLVSKWFREKRFEARPG